jgi:hypothetical protein
VNSTIGPMCQERLNIIFMSEIPMQSICQSTSKQHNLIIRKIGMATLQIKIGSIGTGKLVHTQMVNGIRAVKIISAMHLSWNSRILIFSTQYQPKSDPVLL